MTKEALKLALEALENIKNDPFKFDLKNGIDKAITAIKEALAEPEQKSVAMADYMALTEKYVALKAAQLEQESVAWVGLDLDNMAKAFHRVIEEHHSRKNPFHDPVNGDAMIALRELRGLIAYMKRNTAPPQRTWVGLTDEDLANCSGHEVRWALYWDKLLKEKNHV